MNTFDESKPIDQRGDVNHDQDDTDDDALTTEYSIIHHEVKDGGNNQSNNHLSRDQSVAHLQRYCDKDDDSITLAPSIATSSKGLNKSNHKKIPSNILVDISSMSCMNQNHGLPKDDGSIQSTGTWNTCTARSTTTETSILSKFQRLETNSVTKRSKIPLDKKNDENISVTTETTGVVDDDDDKKPAARQDDDETKNQWSIVDWNQRLKCRGRKNRMVHENDADSVSTWNTSVDDSYSYHHIRPTSVGATTKHHGGDDNDDETSSVAASSTITGFDLVSLNGTSYQRACHRCTFINESKALFCVECGMTLQNNPYVNVDEMIAQQLQNEENKFATKLVEQQEHKRKHMFIQETLLVQSQIFTDDVYHFYNNFKLTVKQTATKATSSSPSTTELDNDNEIFENENLMVGYSILPEHCMVMLASRMIEKTMAYYRTGKKDVSIKIRYCYTPKLLLDAYRHTTENGFPSNTRFSLNIDTALGAAKTFFVNCIMGNVNRRALGAIPEDEDVVEPQGNMSMLNGCYGESSYLGWIALLVKCGPYKEEWAGDSCLMTSDLHQSVPLVCFDATQSKSPITEGLFKGLTRVCNDYFDPIEDQIVHEIMINDYNLAQNEVKIVSEQQGNDNIHESVQDNDSITAMMHNHQISNNDLLRATTGEVDHVDGTRIYCNEKNQVYNKNDVNISVTTGTNSVIDDVDDDKKPAARHDDDETKNQWSNVDWNQRLNYRGSKNRVVHEDDADSVSTWNTSVGDSYSYHHIRPTSVGATTKHHGGDDNDNDDETSSVAASSTITGFDLVSLNGAADQRTCHQCTLINQSEDLFCAACGMTLENNGYTNVDEMIAQQLQNEENKFASKLVEQQEHKRKHMCIQETLLVQSQIFTDDIYQFYNNFKLKQTATKATSSSPSTTELDNDNEIFENENLMVGYSILPEHCMVMLASQMIEKTMTYYRTGKKDVSIKVRYCYTPKLLLNAYHRTTENGFPSITKFSLNIDTALEAAKISFRNSIIGNGNRSALDAMTEDDDVVVEPQGNASMLMGCGNVSSYLGWIALLIKCGPYKEEWAGGSCVMTSDLHQSVPLVCFDATQSKSPITDGLFKGLVRVCNDYFDPIKDQIDHEIMMNDYNIAQKKVKIVSEQQGKDHIHESAQHNESITAIMQNHQISNNDLLRTMAGEVDHVAVLRVVPFTNDFDDEVDEDEDDSK
jgi:RNA polymerase subunit RPABC4/transcription elongation factor Spt4